MNLSTVQQQSTTLPTPMNIDNDADADLDDSATNITEPSHEPIHPSAIDTNEEQPKKKARKQNSLLVLKKCKNDNNDEASLQKTKKAKGKEKKKEDNPIPNIHNIEKTQTLNYSVAELKANLKSYDLYLSGNKQVLHARLFSYLRAVRAVIRMQCHFRGRFVRGVFKLFQKYQSMMPSCVNDQDFYSFEPLKEINKFQLICVTEPEGSVYGFDLSSSVQYKKKLESGTPLTNPYTRSNLDPAFFAELEKIEIASKMGIIPTVFEIEKANEINNLSFEKKVEMKAISLFQHINSLGNYSDASWLLSLSRGRMNRLLRELYDIWNFRLNISRETKRNVCPPHGKPFDLGMTIQTSAISDIELKDVILTILENFVYRGVDRDAQCLGSFYVLGALTLVSEVAAEASPWLFQSFAY
jgi:hypothetical protein